MARLLLPRDHDLLLTLLRTPTVGPLERDAADPEPPRLWDAQRCYAAAATALGMRVVHHAPPDPSVLDRADVPVTVRDAARDPAFLAEQPSLVLRLGDGLPTGRTVMFNVHLDTVAGREAVGFDGARFTGRGAIDAKGPAVALLAGIRAAAAAEPALGRDVTVLVQAVSGEEGGALGTFGTRPLVEAGFVGRLNIFCEPTGLRWLPRATASMTARVAVEGTGAVDDRPDTGHNATVLLGHLAAHLASTLDGAVPGGRVCVGGVHTGQLHNRVYGSGHLLLNLSYASAGEGSALEEATTRGVRSGVRAFAERFAATREFGRTAADAADIVRLSWLKRGLPTLDNYADWATDLFTAAGVARWPASEPAFTCDAIWTGGLPDCFTAVLGPGTLDGNLAHAAGEHADLDDLEAFAGAVRALLVAFCRLVREETPA